MMKTSEIEELVAHQLKCFFLVSDDDVYALNNNIEEAVRHTQDCLGKMDYKYYILQGSENKEIDLGNSVMNCIFLYWLSRYLFQRGKIQLADKVYYLNKIFNSVELFYEVRLPDIWSCEHPLGSVMGKASYGDFFLFYQGCTVGGEF